MFDFAEDDSLWKEDLFSILGVTEETDEKELKNQYKKLAKQHHPDRFPIDSQEQKEAKQIFSKITKAYDVLTNEAKRQQYLDTRRLLADHIENVQESSPDNKKQPGGQKEELKRKQAEDFYVQGEKAYKQQDLDAAIDHYQQALQLNPNVGKYHSRLGKVYAEKGWKGMAQASFKKALGINPRDPIAQEGIEPETDKKSFLGSIMAKFKKK